MVHVDGNIERTYYESLLKVWNHYYKKLHLFIKCEEKNSALIADIAHIEKKQTKDYIKKWQEWVQAILNHKGGNT